MAQAGTVAGELAGKRILNADLGAYDIACVWRRHCILLTEVTMFVVETHHADMAFKCPGH